MLTLAGALAIGEFAGWPFLAAPLQQWLSQLLDRRVQLSGGDDFRVRFIGGLRLHAAQLEIAAPAWSAAPHLLRADDVELDLHYSDLWRAQRGQRLRLARLQAAALDANLERDAEGRVSWQFGPAPVAGATPPLPLFGTIQLGAGVLHYRDAPGAVDVQADLRWSASDSAADSGNPQPRGELRVKASGTLRRLPLKAELVAWGVTPAGVVGATAQPVPLILTARIGRAQLDFKGTALDPLRFDGLLGRFALAGPSLAAVGDAVGVTLPTTGAFHSDGAIRRDGQRWQVVVDAASIGGSRLGGAFHYDAERRVPLLSGRLVGSRLLLVDLGPVVGTTSAVTAAPKLRAAAATPAASSAASAPAALVAATRGRDKVLPDRPFDLAALRAMDANVLVDIASVDLNTSLLEPLQPLRGHLQLSGGVLSLNDLDARTAQGRLQGDLVLDGRTSVAQWQAALRWDGLRLERWIRQARANAAPPFVSGRLSGRATVTGQGRSTAEILASLKGSARTELHGGTISHLVIEAAGLDLAQSLGVIIQGDDALPVTCAVADLVAEGGVFRTRLMVLDTSDSTVWIDGTISLASEALDLRAVVSPKDASPLALRTPLRVQGSLAQPRVSIEKGGLGRKLGSAFLLGLINPLAALIPLIDPGNAAEAGRGAAGCLASKPRGAVARAAVARVAR